jgi:hypothetical protein
MHSFSPSELMLAAPSQSIPPSIDPPINPSMSFHLSLNPSIHTSLPPSPTCTQCDCIVWLAAMTQWMSFVTLISHHITPMHTQLAAS